MRQQKTQDEKVVLSNSTNVEASSSEMSKPIIIPLKGQQQQNSEEFQIISEQPLQLSNLEMLPHRLFWMRTPI